MASDALRFARILSSRSVTTQRVLSWRHGFQVIGIHTTAFSAEMIDLEAHWNRAPEMFIERAMNQIELPEITHMTITIIASLSEPQPTLTILDCISLT